MTALSLRLPVLGAILLGACTAGGPSTGDSDTDPPEPVRYPKDFEIDLDKPNSFKGIFVSGDSELPITFTDGLLYAVDELSTGRFRSYIGVRTEESTTFFPKGVPQGFPATVSLEARVTIPAAGIEPKTYNCIGPNTPFAVSVRLFSTETDWAGLIASTILLPVDDAGPCALQVKKAAVDEFQAVALSAKMDTVTVKDKKLTLFLDNIDLHFFLKEGTAPTSSNEVPSPGEDTGDAG